VGAIKKASHNTQYNMPKSCPFMSALLRGRNSTSSSPVYYMQSNFQIKSYQEKHKQKAAVHNAVYQGHFRSPPLPSLPHAHAHAHAHTNTHTHIPLLLLLNYSKYSLSTKIQHYINEYNHKSFNMHH